MTSIVVIENKISAARKYLTILRELQKNSREEIEKDTTTRGAVERYLYLAAKAVIDLAEAIVAYKNFRKPTTLREAFQILGEEKLISQDLPIK